MLFGFAASSTKRRRWSNLSLAKQSVYQNDSKYRGDREHDAHEFFVTLRDALNDKYGTEDFFSGNSLKGQVCEKCEGSKAYKVYIRDTFQELQLTMPPSYNLMEMLLEYQKQIFSSCEDCDYNSCMVTFFRQLPPVLVFQLKRFNNNLEKDQTEVNFPVQLKVNQEINGSKIAKNYNLYAVCYHLGESIHTGHYTASCKNDGIWYSFSDSEVKKIEEPAAENAYLLFYSREDWNEW